MIRIISRTAHQCIEEYTFFALPYLCLYFIILFIYVYGSSTWQALYISEEQRSNASKSTGFSSCLTFAFILLFCLYLLIRKQHVSGIIHTLHSSPRLPLKE